MSIFNLSMKAKPYLTTNDHGFSFSRILIHLFYTTYSSASNSRKISTQHGVFNTLLIFK